jgi:transposase
LRRGAPWLKPVLVQCAWAAARKKNSYFQAQFLRLKARRGPKKAAVAAAASVLTTAYHMLADGTCYQDLGADHFARRDPARAVAKLANRIRSLGYEVDIRAAA